MVLAIYRQFSERYTAKMVPNIAQILQFPPCELWCPSHTKYLQLRIFRPQYSTARICAAIGGISTIQCALYCKRGAKYSVHPPVNAIWTVVPDIYNVITAPHIQASILNWTYLRWYRIYIDKQMCVILPTWWQTQRTSSSLRNVKCGHGHIQCSYSSAYLGFNIQLNVSPRLL
jgi:hypothetical protein